MEEPSAFDFGRYCQKPITIASVIIKSDRAQKNRNRELIRANLQRILRIELEYYFFNSLVYCLTQFVAVIFENSSEIKSKGISSYFLNRIQDLPISNLDLQ